MGPLRTLGLELSWAKVQVWAIKASISYKVDVPCLFSTKESSIILMALRPVDSEPFTLRTNTLFMSALQKVRCIYLSIYLYVSKCNIEITQTPTLSGIWLGVNLKTDTKRHMFKKIMDHGLKIH